MFLYVLKAKNGEIDYKQKIFDVDFNENINLAIHENKIIITFYNKKVEFFSIIIII